MRNVNFNLFEDEFGNIIREFGVIKYEKRSDNTWVEVQRYESGRSHYVIEDQLYYRSDDILIKLNMDFNNPTCGACYVIGEEIKNKKKITGNHKLFTVYYPSNRLSLHKQTYSDGTCFYSLLDRNDRSKVNYGSRNLDDLITQLKHENKVYTDYRKESDNDIYSTITHANDEMIKYMNQLITSK